MTAQAQEINHKVLFTVWNKNYSFWTNLVNYWKWAKLIVSYGGCIALGKYKGDYELSFMMTRDLAVLAEVAMRRFNQESILHIGYNGEGLLQFQDYNMESIGTAKLYGYLEFFRRESATLTLKGTIVVE